MDHIWCVCPAARLPHLLHTDLVVDSEHRACGHGQALLHWLKEQAAAQQCSKLWLVSGKQRTGAHAFYAASGMDNFGYVFMQDV